MKKIAVLVLFVISIVLSSNAQTFKIIKPGNPNVLNDSTIYVYGTTGTTLELFLDIINGSSNSQAVSARRDSVSEVAGTTNSFCWGANCYSPLVDISPPADAETVAPGDTLQGTNEFTGEYNAAVTGVSTIRYSFFSYANRADSAWITVVYNATPAAINNISSASLSSIFPNPARESVTVNYSLPAGIQNANLDILNILGDRVQMLPLSSSNKRVSINVQSIPSGIYVCEIEASGCKPAYQKLIVAH